MEKLFEQYDVSKTGYLNMSEVARFLQDAAKGAVPTEEEVRAASLPQVTPDPYPRIPNPKP
jgi:hypothetical protein